MDDYRLLTADEIETLKENGCRAEDWTAVSVAEDFQPHHVRNTDFYGEVNLGVMEKNVEVSQGFFKHSGISNATLRNVTIGDNCLIENIGGFINNYEIGNDCLIANVSVMQTTEGATYGEGNIISVLNEAGDGNCLLFSDLNAQLAALMVKHFNDKDVKDALRRMVADNTASREYRCGIIGDGVKIVNTKEITNTVLQDCCEVNGAERISDCTVLSDAEAPTYIGTGVICESTIIGCGSSVINAVNLQSCFVEEACTLSNGFTAEACLFFANSQLSCGEACASFCGPFTVSHHKSTLLIGGQYSFYNAGSNTNYSNHAYKMGPVHYGTLERGSKTASGAHLIMPAQIGAFTVCLGKIDCHPDTRDLPFSYLIASNGELHIVPGQNITSAGFYRDIMKWPRRDRRTTEHRRSIVNYDWLSPFTVAAILRGKRLLENLRDGNPEAPAVYHYGDMLISRSSLQKGIARYDNALRMYMAQVAKDMPSETFMPEPDMVDANDRWVDLAGLLMPESEERSLVSDIKSGALWSVQDVLHRFSDIHNRYAAYRRATAQSLMLDYYGLSRLNDNDISRIIADGKAARQAWLDALRRDAEKEFTLGDVDEEVLDNFLKTLRA